MSNFEDQLLDYIIDPMSADLNAIVKIVLTEVRGLRKRCTEQDEYIVEQDATIKSLSAEIEGEPPQPEVKKSSPS